MIPVAPDFTQPPTGVNHLQAKLANDGLTLMADFGNSLPILNADSGQLNPPSTAGDMNHHNPEAYPRTTALVQTHADGESG